MTIRSIFIIGTFGLSLLQYGCGNQNSVNSSSSNYQNMATSSAGLMTSPTGIIEQNSNVRGDGAPLEEAKSSWKLMERCKHTPVDKIIARPTQGVAPLTVSFDGSTSYDPDKTKIVRWQWGINDGTDTLIDGKKVEHTFQKPGTYSILLTVTNQNGEKNSDCGHKESVKITVLELSDNSKTKK
ncbi:MAG: PKD domain-containing protein [Chloracidobacterium sp.]|nr:PKD domain-containing protein [Chloracidobacterium sp.]